jgi:hypothetical protein
MTKFLHALGFVLAAATLSAPLAAAAKPRLTGEEQLAKALEGLSYREREIIRLRFGLADGYAYTLEEVGTIFDVTRERVRQIEAKAVEKLRQPGLDVDLSGFVDDAIVERARATSAALQRARTKAAARVEEPEAELASC